MQMSIEFCRRPVDIDVLYEGYLEKQGMVVIDLGSLEIFLDKEQAEELAEKLLEVFGDEQMCTV